MEEINNKEVQAPSTCESLDDVTVRGLRKRNLALILGLAGAIMFGGSCDGCSGSLSCKGKEVAGCSCVDSGTKSKNPEPKKEKRKLDF